MTSDDRPEDDDATPHTSMIAAVEASLPDLPRLPRDRAAVAALRLYATLLDDAVDRISEAAEDDEARDFGRMVTAVSKIGPRLERMFDMLGMAPGARPQLPETGPPGGDPQQEAFDHLRAGTTPAGFDHGALVDPSVTEADA